jgi:AcrR family transcriptional regulator
VAAKKPKKPAKPEKKAGYHHGDLRRSLLAEAVAMLEAAPSHHFKDKAALLDAIAEDGFRLLADALEAARALPLSPNARLEASGAAYVKFAVHHPAHVRTMFGKAPSDVPSDGCLNESMRAFGALLSLAQDAAGPGASDKDVRAVTFMAWSSVHGLSLLWLDGDGPVRMTSGGTEEGLMALVADVSAMITRAVGAR